MITCAWTTQIRNARGAFDTYNCAATFNDDGTLIDISVAGHSFATLPRSIRVELQNDAAARWSLWKTNSCLGPSAGFSYQIDSDDETTD